MGRELTPVVDRALPSDPLGSSGVSSSVIPEEAHSQKRTENPGRADGARCPSLRFHRCANRQCGVSLCRRRRSAGAAPSSWLTIPRRCGSERCRRRACKTSFDPRNFHANALHAPTNASDTPRQVVRRRAGSAAEEMSGRRTTARRRIPLAALRASRATMGNRAGFQSCTARAS